MANALGRGKNFWGVLVPAQFVTDFADAVIAIKRYPALDTDEPARLHAGRSAPSTVPSHSTARWLARAWAPLLQAGRAECCVRSVIRQNDSAEAGSESPPKAEQAAAADRRLAPRRKPWRIGASFHKLARSPSCLERQRIDIAARPHVDAQWRQRQRKAKSGEIGAACAKTKRLDEKQP